MDGKRFELFIDHQPKDDAGDRNDQADRQNDETGHSEKRLGGISQFRKDQILVAGVSSAGEKQQGSRQGKKG